MAGFQEILDKSRKYDELIEEVNNYRLLSKENWQYLESKIEEQKQEKNKLEKDKNEYGYDSLCLRVQELCYEAAIARSKCKIDNNHYMDIDYWKKHYDMRAIRIYSILNDLLKGDE